MQNQKDESESARGGQINLCVLGMRRACPPCKFDGFGPALRLVKFAFKFSLNLRLIKFDLALARFCRHGFVNLATAGLRLE